LRRRMIGSNCGACSDRHTDDTAYHSCSHEIVLRSFYRRAYGLGIPCPGVGPSYSPHPPANPRYAVIKVGWQAQIVTCADDQVLIICTMTLAVLLLLRRPSRAMPRREHAKVSRGTDAGFRQP
jgi:hypothetical protein